MLRVHTYWGGRARVFIGALDDDDTPRARAAVPPPRPGGDASDSESGDSSDGEGSSSSDGAGGGGGGGGGGERGEEPSALPARGAAAAGASAAHWRRQLEGASLRRFARFVVCLLLQSAASCFAGGFVPPHELVEHGMFSLGAQVCA